MNSFTSHVIRGLRCCTVLAVLVAFTALPVCADLYTWTDANGVRHFSNEAPPVSQQAAKQSEVRHTDDQYRKWEEQRQSSQDKILEDTPSGDEQSPQKARIGRRGNVVMYATPTCKYCARARAFFAKHKVAYTEYDITADKKAHDRFEKLNGTGVPLIFVGEQRVPGYNEGLLRRLLGIR